MSRFLQKFILIVIVSYVGLYTVSPQLANFCLGSFAVLLIPILILRPVFMDAVYKNSINIVSKQFVFNQYTLTNDHCTVKYTPDEKIVVIDNVASNRGRDKRMFTLTKANKVNINKSWNRICRVFDSFICLDSLVSFFNYETKVDVVLIPNKNFVKTPEKKTIHIDTKNNGPKFVDIDEIQPDTYSQGTEHPRTGGEKFVNLENIETAKPTQEREIPEPKLVELGDALNAGPNKIYVNTATASELSILPGINIVMAKKIVEQRDKNGLFKSEDDFIAVANVKDHFISKIKTMISTDLPEPPKQNNEDEDTGRIIDF